YRVPATQVIPHVCHEEDQQRQVPHIQAERDQSDPAQGPPFKHAFERCSTKKDGKDAQAEARRETNLAQPDKLSIHSLKERPGGVSPAKTPHGNEHEYYNASSPQPWSHAARTSAKILPG